MVSAPRATLGSGYCAWTLLGIKLTDHVNEIIGVKIKAATTPDRHIPALCGKRDVILRAEPCPLHAGEADRSNKALLMHITRPSVSQL